MKEILSRQEQNAIQEEGKLKLLKNSKGDDFIENQKNILNDTIRSLQSEEKILKIKEEAVIQSIKMS